MNPVETPSKTFAYPKSVSSASPSSVTNIFSYKPKVSDGGRRHGALTREMTDRLDVKVDDGTGGKGMEIDEAFERFD